MSRVVIPPGFTLGTSGFDPIVGEEIGTTFTIGIEVHSGGVLLTLAGDDTIQGAATSILDGGSNPSSSYATGIFNDVNASIVTGEGADTISGTALATLSYDYGYPYNSANATGIDNRGAIITGRGDDTISGKADAASDSSNFASPSSNANGINNSGNIEVGEGNNTITGDATATNNSTLLSFTSASANGILNNLNASIVTGNGDNNISGIAQATNNITTPYDYPTVNATANGINNSGLIVTGTSGSDRIEGVASAIATSNSDVYGLGFPSVDAAANGIFNNTNASIITGNSDDEIDGNATATSNEIAAYGFLFNGNASAFGIYNAGSIDMGAGNDKITSSATATSDNNSYGGAAYAIANGLFNSVNALIVTGYGKDNISGNAIATDSSSVPGIFIATGIDNSGEIITGRDDDTISGSATTLVGIGSSSESIGISNNGSIDAGNGNDIITGNATAVGAGAFVYGIYGTGTIQMGNGNDTLIASSTLNGVLQKVNLGDGLTIDMGNGNDYVKGFGQATVNGGEGWNGNKGGDTLDLSYGFNRSDLVVSGVNPNDPNEAANFTFGGITMTTTGFEKFIFADTTFIYDTLTNG
jgi:hypothetical protein